MNRVSQETIARMLGVSKNAVSLALAGKPGVSEDTRRKIEEAAHRLGYSKPTIRKRQQEHPRTVGLVVREGFLHEKLFFGPLITFLQHELSIRGMNSAVYAVTPQDEQDLHAPPWVGNASLVGLLTVSKVSREYLDLLSAVAPLVLVDHYDPSIPHDAVLTANVVGGYMATAYLFSLNHRDIGFLGVFNPNGAPSNVERAFGYRLALESNLGSRAPWICAIPEDADESAIAHWLDNNARSPSAWFCSNDIVAFQLTRCLKSRNLQVPGDISIVGFDDLPLAILNEPPLTTFRVDPTVFARRAVDRLFWRLENPHAPVEHLSIRPTFIARESARRV